MKIVESVKSKLASMKKGILEWADVHYNGSWAAFLWELGMILGLVLSLGLVGSMFLEAWQLL